MCDEHNLLDYECDNQGYMLACGGRGIFEEDNLSTFQVVVAVNDPTPVDPVVPARMAEAEEACWQALKELAKNLPSNDTLEDNGNKVRSAGVDCWSVLKEFVTEIES